MIFVTVGNATQGFTRLLDAVEAFANEGGFAREKLLIQTGSNSNFRSTHAKLIAFLPLEKFQENIRRANIVISHAGAGTLLHLFSLGRVPIVMPRQKKFGEHIDDHQVELVKALAKDERIIPLFEGEGLPKAISYAYEHCEYVHTHKEASTLTYFSKFIQGFVGKP